MNKAMKRVVVVVMLLAPICCGCGIFMKFNIEDDFIYPAWHCETNIEGKLLMLSEMPIAQAGRLQRELTGWETLLIDWTYNFTPLPRKPFHVNVIIIFSNCEQAQKSLEGIGLKNNCFCGNIT